MTSNSGWGETMAPWEILSRAIFKSTIEVFPMLEMNMDEKEFLLRWVRQRGPAAMRVVRAKERRLRVPAGPQGYWSRWYRHIGRAYRPHRLDEVFVEWMSLVWIDRDAHGYLTVISSGPFGGLCAVFWNDALISEEQVMPFQTLEEAQAWAKGRAEICQGISTGKA